MTFTTFSALTTSAFLVLACQSNAVSAKTTTSFPKDVSGAQFIRACEGSGGTIGSEGNDHLSCTNSNGTTDCATDKSGKVEVCVHNTPTRTPPKRSADNGHNSGGQPTAGGGNGGGGSSGGGRPASASGGNSGAAGSASAGGGGNSIN